MYYGYITKLKNVRKHPNADRLQLAECFESTVIVGLDAKTDDVVLYFPTDGQLGKEYAERNNLLRKKDENGKEIGGYLDVEKRNIKAIKLRGEKSDGLVMSLASLKDFTDITKLKLGDKINILNGTTICEKYIPRIKQLSKNSNSVGKNKKKKSNINEKIEFPQFEQHIETDQLQYNISRFKEGDLCYITLKMHGTSGRTGNLQKYYTPKPNFIQRLLHIKPKTKVNYDLITGSRRVDLVDINKKDGFYGDNDFRKKYHDLLQGKLYQGETIYYEIVGWVKENQLIMGECNNKKTQDKEFIKQYGDTTKFTYGCNNGENEVYVYRMTMTSTDGLVIEYPWELVKLRCEQMGLKTVPQFERFFYTNEKDLWNRVNKYVDGVDPIGKNHIREGIVVRIEDRSKFTALKHKNFNFKVLESIIKDIAEKPDMEEEQDMVNNETNN